MTTAFSSFTLAFAVPVIPSKKNRKKKITFECDENRANFEEFLRMPSVFFPLEVTLLYKEDNSYNSTAVSSRLKYIIDFLKGVISKHSAH